MKIRNLFAVGIAAALLAACGGGESDTSTTTVASEESTEISVSDAESASNPFFEESTLLYGMPAFDQIKDEHYLPAFERGMAEELSEYETIVSNPEAATFENTIVAMERAGQLLDRTGRVFGAMGGAHTNDNIKELETLLAPVFSAHNDSIYLNKDLFARIGSLYEVREELGLDPESLRLLERYYLDFVRSVASRVSGSDARIGRTCRDIWRHKEDVKKRGLARPRRNSTIDALAFRPGGSGRAFNTGKHT